MPRATPKSFVAEDVEEDTLPPEEYAQDEALDADQMAAPSLKTAAPTFAHDAAASSTTESDQLNDAALAAKLEDHRAFDDLIVATIYNETIHWFPRDKSDEDQLFPNIQTKNNGGDLNFRKRLRVNTADDDKAEYQPPKNKRSQMDSGGVSRSSSRQ